MILPSFPGETNSVVVEPLIMNSFSEITGNFAPKSIPEQIKFWKEVLKYSQRRAGLTIEPPLKKLAQHNQAIVFAKSKLLKLKALQ